MEARRDILPGFHWKGAGLLLPFCSARIGGTGVRGAFFALGLFAHLFAFLLSFYSTRVLRRTRVLRSARIFCRAGVSLGKGKSGG